MGFLEAIKTCLLSKYVDFEGRASRSEYWWFALFSFLIGFFLGWIPILGWLLVIALILPSIAVAVRRLHDTDRSGWWYLLCFVPFVNLVLVYFYVCIGTQGDNQYGQDPLVQK